LLDLERLRARLPASPLTRFAPSPTGRLHLGHIVNAIFVWGVARALGGRVLLRIEDHDRERSLLEYERGILDDLAWLGLEPDAHAPRQSERSAAYESALATLHARGLVFACRCSRREIGAGAVPGLQPRYAGTCRALGLSATPGLALRVRLGTGIETFDDARRGVEEQDPDAQCGDLLVRDRAGQWTYQFAVTVDDWEQNVDLVIRGEDLLSSTGRQMRLARLLGRRHPAVFLHHPLLYGPRGVKLSKSNRDAGVSALRADGWTPEAVLGEAAARAGLLEAARTITARDLPLLFSSSSHC
jgi:glutamyl-tRNA synthetase/glutamyl-Q tRNA(Asp) synthetase